MTHRSRICAVLIDTGAATHETVARFWSEALGRQLEYSAQERYANLLGAHLDFTVQRVEAGHEGVHFDIETDNVAAEVARLEKLGAKRVREPTKRAGRPGELRSDAPTRTTTDPARSARVGARA